MKKILVVLLVLTLGFSQTGCDSGGGGTSDGGGGGKYAWVLVETKDQQLSEIKSTEENFEFTYTFDYSPGSYGVRWVFDGETKEFFNIIHGESYGGRCDFGEVPQSMAPGEMVTIDVSMTETENNLSGWEGLVHGYAEFVGSDQSFNESSSSDIYFTNNTDTTEDWRLTLNTKEGVSFIETKISAIAPEGKLGDRIVLRLVFNISALAIGTEYTYELQKQ